MNSTYSFCMARTTAREKGAELALALMVAAKERLRVEENMHVLPSARARVSSCTARATCTPVVSQLHAISPRGKPSRGIVSFPFYTSIPRGPNSYMTKQAIAVCEC